MIVFSSIHCREDSDVDPCSSCPSQKKHHILRIMYSNRRLFSPAFKKALINGLFSGKDVKSLVPSLGKIEKKSRFGKVVTNNGETPCYQRPVSILRIKFENLTSYLSSQISSYSLLSSIELSFWIHDITAVGVQYTRNFEKRT